MINRRDLLRAVAAEGLAFWSGPAFGQSQAQETDEDEAADGRPPVQADERVNQVLAPVRDEHHLPGLIAAIVTGQKLAAIGGLGIRKIGSPEPIRVTDQVHLGSCTKAMTATDDRHAGRGGKAGVGIDASARCFPRRPHSFIRSFKP